MAKIIKLEVTQSGDCPGESATITAITDPAAALIDRWKVNGEEEITFSNTLEVGLGNNPKIVEAELDASILSVTIPSFKIVELKLVFTPPFQVNPLPGYVLTGEPAAPSIKVKAVGIGGPVSDLEWSVLLVNNPSTFELCSDNAPVIIHEDVLSPAGSSEEIEIDFADLIRGGRLGVIVKGKVGGCKVNKSQTVTIGGTNPLLSDIIAELPNGALRQIACRESGNRQFDAPPEGGEGRCPLFGPGGRVGIMQIKDPTLDEIWDWKKNIEKGIEIFNDLKQKSKEYNAAVKDSDSFAQLVEQFNQKREQQGLSRLKEVLLPEFTREQIERDAIRGYNGWFGKDQFGFDLHEFRIPMKEENGVEILNVSVNEETLTGLALWEEVPPEERPAEGENNKRDYVNETLICGGGDSVKCDIEIISTPAERSFSPPSVTGEEVFRAEAHNVPDGSDVVWEIRHFPHETGNVDLGAQADITNGEITLSEKGVKARHPNLARVRVNVMQNGTTLCSDTKQISVPQFFHIFFETDGEFFNDALIDLGLRRLPPEDGVLTTDQQTTNDKVKGAVMDEIFNILKFEFNSVNVRFTIANPEPIVGTGNFATITLLGFDKSDSGSTFVSATDKTNLDASNPSFIFCRRFADRNSKLAGDSNYKAIFDSLAARDPDGHPDGGAVALPGIPVDVSDFAEPPVTVRQKTVSAAILAFGRMIGTTIAHESGHSLSLFDHNIGNTSEIMDEGGFNTFSDKTGILNFNSSTGDLVFGPPFMFGSTNLQILHSFLPILNK